MAIFAVLALPLTAAILQAQRAQFDSLGRTTALELARGQLDSLRARGYSDLARYLPGSGQPEAGRPIVARQPLAGYPGYEVEVPSPVQPQPYLLQLTVRIYTTVSGRETQVELVSLLAAR